MDESHWSMSKWCCVTDKQRSYNNNGLIDKEPNVALGSSAGLKNAVKMHATYSVLLRPVECSPVYSP
jgi:hypothetical protein